MNQHCWFMLLHMGADRKCKSENYERINWSTPIWSRYFWIASQPFCWTLPCYCWYLRSQVFSPCHGDKLPAEFPLDFPHDFHWILPWNLWTCSMKPAFSHDFQMILSQPHLMMRSFPLRPGGRWLGSSGYDWGDSWYPATGHSYGSYGKVDHL